MAERHKLHGWLLLTSEDGSAVDVVLYTSQMIDLIDVFILVFIVVPLSPVTGQQHGNLVFIVGTHSHQEPIVSQQIFIGLLPCQF